jgi:hypothetical protein
VSTHTQYARVSMCTRLSARACARLRLRVLVARAGSGSSGLGPVLISPQTRPRSWRMRVLGGPGPFLVASRRALPHRTRSLPHSRIHSPPWARFPPRLAPFPFDSHAIRQVRGGPPAPGRPPPPREPRRPALIRRDRAGAGAVAPIMARAAAAGLDVYGLRLAHVPAGGGGSPLSSRWAAGAVTLAVALRGPDAAGVCRPATGPWRPALPIRRPHRQRLGPGPANSAKARQTLRGGPALRPRCAAAVKLLVTGLQFRPPAGVRCSAVFRSNHGCYETSMTEECPKRRC